MSSVSEKAANQRDPFTGHNGNTISGPKENVAKFIADFNRYKSRHGGSVQSSAAAAAKPPAAKKDTEAPA